MLQCFIIARIGKNRKSHNTAKTRIQLSKMDKSALISIIIPFHNSEKHLEKCLNSIVNQTYNELEIILVNDGSEDGSPDIAERFAREDGRICVISIPQSGVSVARNTGLENASGEYIMFADSDDMMNTKIIKRMMKVMQSTDADIVSCGIERTEILKEEPISRDIVTDTYTRKEYLRLFFKIRSNEWVHYPVAKLYKKELLMMPLYPPGIRVGEDVVGTYRAITKAKKIVALKDVGYYYFINPESATGEFSEKDFDLIEVWDQMVRITKGVKPDHTFALLGRKRINFTLLLRLLTQVPAKEIEVRYGARQKRLLRDLRRYEDELLHSPVILSRKVMIFLLCHFYDQVAFGCDLYVRLKKKRGLL